MLNNSWSDYSSYFHEQSLVAGFTNIHFPFLPDSDRSEFAKILQLDQTNIIIPKQIHSNNVVKCYKSGKIINTDGIITNNRNLVLSIQVADCIPIYLFDTKRHNLGLVHAGWRGVNSGIVKNCISKMQELESNSSDIKVLLGPSIRQCCFEVGPEVGKMFDSKYHKNGKGDRIQLDLQTVVTTKLINTGIQKNNITDISECTLCTNKYHSYRRNGKQAGRMIAMFGWKKIIREESL